ncbi:hypothetical protein [Mycobacterium kyorinense]|nr:hypothetical protein [Mycobacterium kyorinense]
MITMNAFGVRLTGAGSRHAAAAAVLAALRHRAAAAASVDRGST